MDAIRSTISLAACHSCFNPGMWRRSVNGNELRQVAWGDTISPFNV